jgi:signal transduction histidine kinase
VTAAPAARWGLASRFLAAIVAVVLVGSATAWVVAVAVGPVIFHEHMSSGAAGPAVVAHAEEAFRTASALALALALLVALGTSIAVSLFVARRIARSLAPVTAATRRVAAGDHSARVPAVGMGVEFDDLVAAFNSMAGDLARVESTRTRMLADLAHEMRTPVATLDGYLEAILDGVQQADEATVTMLRDQVARLARLAQDITLVTTAEEGRLSMSRKPVAVAGLVDSAAAQAAAAYAHRGVTLDVHLAEDAADAVVQADAIRLGQVLTNLLDNALRHTPPGGHVELGVGLEGDAVHLSVSDDGEGIPPEHLPFVFDRFYRVDAARDRAHGGSGVGLAIAKAITHAHGGTVTAASPGPGRGATFTLTLPLPNAALTDASTGPGARTSQA